MEVCCHWHKMPLVLVYVVIECVILNMRNRDWQVHKAKLNYIEFNWCWVHRCVYNGCFIIMASNVVQPIKIVQIYSSNQAYNKGGLFQFCTHAGLAVFWHSYCRAWNIHKFCTEARLRSLSTSHMFICSSCQYHMLRPSLTYVQHLQTYFFIFVLRVFFFSIWMLQPMCKTKSDGEVMRRSVT